jgi:hypothetical protein
MRPVAFPRPWSVEEQAVCLVVRDGNGQQLAYAARRPSCSHATKRAADRGKRRQAAGAITLSVTRANSDVRFWHRFWGEADIADMAPDVPLVTQTGRRDVTCSPGAT